MGRTRLLLVAVVTCILLAHQTALTNSIPWHEESQTQATNIANTCSPATEPGTIVIDARLEKNAVVFSWSQKPKPKEPPKYEARYRSQILLCEEYNFTDWGLQPNSSITIKTAPYSNVTLEVRDNCSSANQSKWVTIDGTKPETKVESVKSCDTSSTLEAVVEKNCSKYNGKEMSVLFSLKVSNENLLNRSINKSSILKGNKATLNWTDLDLRPFTKYTATAIPANAEGAATNQSLTMETTFLTRPEKPGKVRNLTIVDVSSSALMLTWSAPDDNPPKGELESYLVEWRIEGLTSGGDIEKVDGDTTNLNITRLKPSNSYSFTVKAKNKDVDNPGPPASITRNAIPRKDPPPVTSLIITARGTTSLNVSWSPPETEDIQYYEVILKFNETKINVTRTSSTTIKFDSLTASTSYMVKVKACITKMVCSNVTVATEWTWPDPPRVTDMMRSLGATDTTITIQLPTLENPPGYHWVLLKRDGGGSNGIVPKTIKNEAKRIVEHVRNTRPKRATHSHDDDELYIAKEIEVVEGGEDTRNAILGDDSSEPSAPLESNTSYVVVVVTEKRSGSHSELFACEPQVFKTARGSNGVEAIKLIGGICAAAVVIVVIGTLLLMAYNNRREKKSGVYESSSSFSGEVVNELMRTDDEVPLTEATNGTICTQENEIGLEEKEPDKTNGVQENVYANINHEISRKDLEMYLPRAMFSAETTMEFNSVPSHMPGKTVAETLIPENVPKNRYRNDISYDDTRVRLPLYNNIPHSDYINANFVQDPLGCAAYIATQGPKDHNADTIGAFWRMIWHTKCSMILMVANLVEGDRVKVSQYWPETEPLVKEGVRVALKSFRIVMDFAVRTFILTVDDTEREVTQYQYTAWPDHGVPQTAYGLAHMLKAAITHYEAALGGPITVHCSAGIGRTGTIILTLFLMRQLDAFNAINPRKALHALRTGRGRLVENTEQYTFVHKLLHELLFGMRTTFTCDSFIKEVAALHSTKTPDGTLLLYKEFQKIKNLPKDLTFKHGKDPTCAHLNRNPTILPADKRMAFLQSREGGLDSQYLNVIQINGFDRKNAYLAGEHPQPHTLAKMWHLVVQRRVSVWLLLQELPLNDSSFPDVVLESSSLQHITVKASQPHHLENFTEYSVSVTVREKGNTKSHTCTLLMLKGWPHTARLPRSPTALIGAIEKAESLLSPQTHLLFTCSDGVTGCGVMATLLVAVSRAKLIQEVDLYRSVVTVQYDRPQFILDFAQYRFLYTAMKTFLDTNKHYGNFA